MTPEKIFAWIRRSVVIQQLFIFVIYSLLTFMLAGPTKCLLLPENLTFLNLAHNLPLGTKVFIYLPFLHCALLFLCAFFSLLNKQSVWMKYLLSSLLLFVMGIATFFVGFLADFYKLCW